jgi:sugar lactone lactonase YvrE
MPDTKEWIERVRRVDAPTLWNEIELRSHGPVEPERSHLRRSVVLLVTSVAIIGLVLYGLRELGRPAEVPLGPGQIVRYHLQGPPQPISVGDGAAWVKIGSGSGTVNGLVRIDTATGEQRSIETPGGDWTAVGGGYAWLLTGGSVNRLDPQTGEILGSTPVPGHTNQIIGTSKGVWVTSEQAVSFINADGDRTTTVPMSSPNLIATGGSSMWVATEGGRLVSLDPETGRIGMTARYRDVCTMDVGGGTLWVASCFGEHDRLLGFDAATGRRLFDRPIEGSGQMRYANGVLWIAERDPSNESTIRIVPFDPRNGVSLDGVIEIPRDPSVKRDVSLRVLSTFPPHVFFVVGEGSFWVTEFSTGEVIRLPIPSESTSSAAPSTTTVASLDSNRYPLASAPDELAVAGGFVWASEGARQQVQKIDPATGDVLATISLDGYPTSMADGSDVVWVASVAKPTERVVGIDTQTNEIVRSHPGLTGPLAETDEGLWAFQYRAPDPSWMVLIDPDTGDVLRHVEVPAQPFTLATSGNTVWTLDFRGGSLFEISGDNAHVVTDHSSGVWLAGTPDGVYLSVWAQGTPNPPSGPGGSAFIDLDGTTQLIGDIYNFRPSAVADDRVWFVAGPHDGDLSGVCGMRTSDGVVDECANVPVNVEGIRQPVVFDPTTNSLWAVSEGAAVYEIPLG